MKELLVDNMELGREYPDDDAHHTFHHIPNPDHQAPSSRGARQTHLGMAQAPTGPTPTAQHHLEKLVAHLRRTIMLPLYSLIVMGVLFAIVVLVAVHYHQRA